ncbi:MAG: hypothetical protein ACXVFT_15650 [Solirubrobacteraceae bacterium]
MHRPSRPDQPVVRTSAAFVARAALQRVLAERFEARAAGVGAGPYVERLDRAIAGAAQALRHQRRDRDRVAARRAERRAHGLAG